MEGSRLDKSNVVSAKSNTTERDHDEVDRTMNLGFRQTCNCIPALPLSKPTDLSILILHFPEHKITQPLCKVM